MRLIAFSLAKPTCAFTAAMSALRSVGHTVDFFVKRSFAESVQGYQGLLLSLGDVMTAEAQPVKLAALKAACDLPVCLFLDRPLVREITPEAFWASAVVGETTSDRVHRSEMLVALKGEWRARIENRLAQWQPWGVRGIIPSFAFMRQPSGWDPTAFHFTPAVSVPKAGILNVERDNPDLHKVAAAKALFRYRDGERRDERWSPLPIDCVRLRTIYTDQYPNHDLERACWGDEYDPRLPEALEIGELLDQQASLYLGAAKPTREESAARIDALLRDEFRAAVR